MDQLKILQAEARELLERIHRCDAPAGDRISSLEGLRTHANGLARNLREAEADRNLIELAFGERYR